jgi:hypothetical protein
MHLLGALMRIGDATSVEPVAAMYEIASRRDFQQMLLLSVLSHIADRGQEDPQLQEQIWRTVVALSSRESGPRRRDLYMQSDLVHRVDSSAVVPTLLGRYVEEREDIEKGQWFRYLILDRLAGCTRPNQLRGWDYIADAFAISQLENDARRDTEATGRWTTQAMQLKEAAANDLICIGAPRSVAVLTEGIVSETNTFLRANLIKQLSCFQTDFQTWPPAIRALITQPFNAGGEDPETDAGERIAAFSLAQSSASPEALHALISFGFTFKGNVLLQTVDAIAAVAVALAESGDAAAPSAVVESALRGATDRHRTAAAGALEALAASGHLAAEHVDDLVQGARDESRSNIERSGFVAALGHITRGRLRESTIAHLVEWARRPAEWLGGRALEALARQRILAERPDLLSDLVGLRFESDGWGIDEARPLTDATSFVIGLLYTQQPSAFAPSIAYILRHESWLTVARLVQALQEPQRDGQAILPEVVRTAALDRIRNHQSSSFGEPGLFRVLAAGAPRELLSEPWELAWGDWLPESRLALAEAAGTIANLDQPALDRQNELLTLLTADAQYGVRRAAFRALSRTAPESLEALCLSWSEDASMAARQRAAEGFGWLPDAPSPDDPNEHLRIMQFDPELPVRTVAEQSRRLRRQRMWAAGYLDQILAVRPTSNADVLANWRYAKALSAVGDDQTLEVLREQLEHPRLPLHVRHWLSQAISALEEQWRKTTRDWPQPWMQWAGRLEQVAIEKGYGEIIGPGGRRLTGNYSVWHRPSETPHRPSDWGGAVSIDGDGWGLLNFSDNFILKFEDGREAVALASRVEGSLLTLKGNGPFPAAIR